jgi:cbb3-type cytochrome oxidase maturation protein
MMDFFFLVPIAIGLGLAGLASLMWTLKNGQYDDLEGAAERILFDGHDGPSNWQQTPRRDDLPTRELECLTPESVAIP